MRFEPTRSKLIQPRPTAYHSKGFDSIGFLIRRSQVRILAGARHLGQILKKAGIDWTPLTRPTDTIYRSPIPQNLSGSAESGRAKWERFEPVTRKRQVGRPPRSACRRFSHSRGSVRPAQNFANTEPRPVSMSLAVAKRAKAAEGPARAGYKPLMRNRTGQKMPAPIGSTASDTLSSERGDASTLRVWLYLLGHSLGELRFAQSCIHRVLSPVHSTTWNAL